MNNTQAIVYNIREVIKLKEINAELLGALQDCLSLVLYAVADADILHEVHNARKAIAKAKS